MIREVRDTASESPEDNYTEAVCDACDKACPESRLPGRRGSRARDRARALAHEAGWIDRLVPDRSRRKYVGAIRLYCPACAAGVAAGKA